MDSGSQASSLKKTPSSDGTTTGSSSRSAVKAIESWEEFISCLRNSYSKLVVLCFMAPWSEPWKLMKPVLDSVVLTLNDDQVEVRTLSVEDFNYLARLLRVEALPTFVLVKQHRLVGRFAGINRQDLVTSINKHLTPTPTPTPAPETD